MVDKSALGAEGKEFELAVERGKIREFATATRSTNPAYFDTNPPIPPTFLTTAFFWEEYVDDANPWHLVDMSQERGMHAEQEYRIVGEVPRAGDTLLCRSYIDEIYDKDSKSGGTLTFVVMVTEFRNESGELVAEARLTGVEKQQAHGEDAERGDDQ